MQVDNRTNQKSSYVGICLSICDCTKMASLDVARHAASVGAWHTILEVERGAAAAQIRKACRTLQRDAHPDKGGSPELSQLINRARDALLGQCPETARQRAARRAGDEEEERRAEVAQRAEDQRKRDAAEAEKLAERERTRRVALQRSSKRGGKARSAVYLSQSTRLLFPRLGVRISALQRKGCLEKARSLAYAAEAEIASRRATRESMFPKTVGLASRDPVKAALLAGLKARYDVAYQRVRYIRTQRGVRKAVAFSSATLPRLRLSWVLREAWTVLLAQPPPIHGAGSIPM